MSESNKDIAVAFYKKILFEGQVEDAFRLYAGSPIASTTRWSKTAWTG